MLKSFLVVICWYVVGGFPQIGGLGINDFVGVWVVVGDDGCLPEGMGGFIGVWVDFGMGGGVLIIFGGGELQASAGCRTLSLSKCSVQCCFVVLLNDPLCNFTSLFSCNF